MLKDKNRESDRFISSILLLLAKLKTPTLLCMSDINLCDSACYRHCRAVNPVQVITCLCETTAECCKFNTGSWYYLLHHRWVILHDWKEPYLIVSIYRHWNRRSMALTKWRQVEEGNFPVSNCLRRIFICSVCADHELSMSAKYVPCSSCTTWNIGM